MKSKIPAFVDEIVIVRDGKIVRVVKGHKESRHTISLFKEEVLDSDRLLIIIYHNFRKDVSASQKFLPIIGPEGPQFND